ncbi:hypothetical protein WOLCODRAFT_114341 [Wolfiporia cocos MD-104 SS10]|uniref:LIM zinc-binding domain-containing protein n=1 Tax=Wolfiporia cocos (strain MD-104) TaxID=742152 RepID=A0A2H3JDH7_WOLCO|nr:hypothetical protein WOLCODRAFT_114341 [Wolfiporia cocos MD-104 SS10]
MAQLLAPAPDAGRISQFLPTVKCSSCNEPVSIHDLTDHVCQSSSPVSPGGKPLVSPLSAIELDPQRVQSGQVPFPASKTVLAKQPPPKTPLPAIPATPTTPSAASIRLPFFEKFKAKQPEALENKPDPDPEQKQAARPPSPSSDTESEYDGLAYARSDAGEGEFDDKPLKCPIPPLKIPDKQKDGHDAGTDGGKVRFPSMAGSESQYSPTSPSSPRPPMRSISAAAALRPALRSTGALDRVSEDTSEFLVPASAPPVPDSHRDSVNRPPKLPMRSHTSPTLSAGRQEHAGVKGKARVGRVCARCEKAIDDRRWIAMDGGSVLCDKCWKNMYLPKCRRCNLPIEKQAVSSSDGQLKGKYHRDCFNCDKCHKPFPDKSFYVLDGKPFCAYHYHEANKSLCTAATCGQPIEGPCAVSHTGHRYHPDHLLCEYTRCTERLVDYWEMDGRMLCEWHAQKVMGEAADEVADSLEELPETSRDSIAVSRAMKRTTRFIDLGGSELR